MCVEPGLYDVPVDDFPEGCDVLGTAVSVIDVVGVLPDVNGEERLEALNDGVAGVGLLGDDELAVGVSGKPGPAGAKEPGRLGGELLLEGVERAELCIDR